MEWVVKGLGFIWFGVVLYNGILRWQMWKRMERDIDG